VLFFGLFCYFSVFFPLAPLEEAKQCYFRYFLLIFGLFFVGPSPEKFSADALESIYSLSIIPLHTIEGFCLHAFVGLGHTKGRLLDPKMIHSLIIWNV